MLRKLHHVLGGSLISLDDREELTAAKRDPVGYLEDRTRPVIIDEVQRAGDPFVLTIKSIVDRDNRRGSFILSGSSRFLTVPTLSESLAGRMALLELLPFSMAERAGGRPDVVDRLFQEPRELLRDKTAPFTRHEYMRLVCVGGFPEAVTKAAGRTRRGWFTGYLRTLVQREIEDFADIRRSDTLSRLARLVCAQTAQELNIAELARRLDATPELIRTYLPLLETVYLIHHLPFWSRNLTARVVHRPKLHAMDTGLAAAISSQSPDALARPTSAAAGPLLETFVVNELRKLSTVSETQVELGHFRDRDGREVDCVMESFDGRVVGIEVKATSTPDPRDARHLTLLRDRLGDDFVAGVLFHTGRRALPLGDRLMALPVSTLWGGLPVPT